MAKKTEKEKSPRAKVPNSTLEARFNGKLTKGFTDLRDIVLSIVNRTDDDPDNLDYDIYLPDYKEKFGMQFDRNVYRKIQADVRRQMKYDTLITMINERGNEVDFFPFQEVEWCGNGVVHVVLGRRFKKLLVEKGNPYTIYSIAYTLPMKSKYSKVMFPRLMEHTWQPRMKFNYRGDQKDVSFTYFETIEQFRDICGIPESYRMNNIRKTCDIIIQDIEECTDYTAEVFFNTAQVPGSTSKKPMVTHIAWNMTKKKTEVIEPVEWSVAPDDGQLQDQIRLEDYPLQELIIEITKLDERSAMSIISNSRRHGMETSTLIKICREAVKKKDVDSLGAYINAMVSRGGFSEQAQTGTAFNNFNQRDYDYDDLEKKLRNK